MGDLVGTLVVGDLVGTLVVGEVVGDLVGKLVVGDTLGDFVGVLVVGDFVGVLVVGEVVGDLVGTLVVGDAVGMLVVGDTLGDFVGVLVVGDFVGWLVVGERDGNAVGFSVVGEGTFLVRSIHRRPSTAFAGQSDQVPFTCHMATQPELFVTEPPLNQIPSPFSHSFMTGSYVASLTVCTLNGIARRAWMFSSGEWIVANSVQSPKSSVSPGR